MSDNVFRLSNLCL